MRARLAPSAAHGKFLPPRRRARQQQVGKIHSGNQQNGSHRGPQRNQRPPQLPHHVHLQRHGNESPLVTPQRLRFLHVEIDMGCNAIGVVQSLGHRHPRLHPAHQRYDVAPHALVVQVQRRKKIDLLARRKHRAEVEAGRQHTHHLERRSVQIDGLAHYRRIGGELPSPVGIGQQRHRVRPRSRFVGGKQAAYRRLHAQYLEEIADHHDAGCRLGLAAAGQAQIVGGGEGLVPGHVLEGAILRAKLLVGVGGKCAAGDSALGRRRSDPHQLLRLGEGKRAQQQRVHHAEHGYVGADRESQNQHRHTGKSRLAPEGSQGITNVLPHIVPIILELSAAFPRLSHARSLLLQRAQIAQPPLGFAAGSLLRPTLADQLVYLFFQVEPQLVFHVRRRIRSEETRIAPPQWGDFHWHSSCNGGCAAPSTLATAAA